MYGLQKRKKKDNGKSFDSCREHIKKKQVLKKKAFVLCISNTFKGPRKSVLFSGRPIIIRISPYVGFSSKSMICTNYQEIFCKSYWT